MASKNILVSAYNFVAGSRPTYPQRQPIPQRFPSAPIYDPANNGDDERIAHLAELAAWSAQADRPNILRAIAYARTNPAVSYDRIVVIFSL